MGLKKTDNTLFRILLLKKFILLIETELNLFIVPIHTKQKTPPSHCKWFGNKVDIGELALAIYLTAQIKLPDGSNLSFSAFCKLFYIFFGLECPEPHDIKRKVFDRKKNLTQFLDRMKLLVNDNFENLSC